MNLLSSVYKYLRTKHVKNSRMRNNWAPNSGKKKDICILLICHLNNTNWAWNEYAILHSLVRNDRRVNDSTPHIWMVQLIWKGIALPRGLSLASCNWKETERQKEMRMHVGCMDFLICKGKGKRPCWINPPYLTWRNIAHHSTCMWNWWTKEGMLGF